MSSVPTNPESSSGPGAPPVALLKARPIAPVRSSSPKPLPGNPDAPFSSFPKASPVVLNGSAAEASRNLALGVAAVLAAVPIGGIALWWAPKESFVAIATAVIVGLCLFLALQFRLLLQRNGTFLLLAGALALTFLVPIGVRIMATGSEWAQTFAEFKHQQQLPSTALHVPVPAAAPAPSLPVQAPAAAPAVSISVPASVAVAPPVDEKQAVPRSEPKEAAVAKSEPESKPEPQALAEDPVARATRQAKDEAIRLYPALQNTGTPEHSLYLDAYNELTRARKFEFFKDPKWPLKIADMLASREGWVRSDAKGPSPAVSAAKKSPMPGSEINLLAPPVRNEASTSVPSTPVAGSVAASVSEAAADPAEEAVNKAMLEARRRYPAVGREGSPENKAYLEAYQDLDSRNTDFFENTDWPVRLVELVAKQEGWKRSEGPSTGDNAAGKKIGEGKELSLPQ